LPDDREVYVPGAFTWPDIPGELWWEEEVQTIALKGAPMTLVNNTAAITKVLTEWNLTHGWPRSPARAPRRPPDRRLHRQRRLERRSAARGRVRLRVPLADASRTGCG
jgi:hypothetical protein